MVVNVAKLGRLSHRPMHAFIAKYRTMSNFWLRPSNINSINNALQFLKSTIFKLGSKIDVLLSNADSGLYDDAMLTFLQNCHTDYIISAKLTHGLQCTISQQVTW